MKNTVLLLLCFWSLKAFAQTSADDSSWYYSNLIQDYINADYVAWVNVGNTNIEDTIGAYTIQQVNFKPIKFFKGAGEDHTFYAWLEQHHVVWKAGIVRGFFLKKAQDEAKKVRQYWMENSGFSERDADFVASLTDTPQLKKQIEKWWPTDKPGAWIRATITALPSLENDSFETEFQCTIELQEDSEMLSLSKGKQLTIAITPDHYSNAAKNIEQFKKGKSYDFFIFKSDNEWRSKSEFIFE